MFNITDVNKFFNDVDSTVFNRINSKPTNYFNLSNDFSVLRHIMANGDIEIQWRYWLTLSKLLESEFNSAKQRDTMHDQIYSLIEGLALMNYYRVGMFAYVALEVLT